MATVVAKHLHPVEMLERMTAREVLDLEDPEGILRSLESVMDDHYQPAKLRDKTREWVAGLRILVGTRAEFLEGVRHVTNRDLRDDDMFTWLTQGDMKDLENAALSAPQIKTLDKEGLRAITDYCDEFVNYETHGITGVKHDFLWRMLMWLSLFRVPNWREFAEA